MFKEGRTTLAKGDERYNITQNIAATKTYELGLVSQTLAVAFDTIK